MTLYGSVRDYWDEVSYGNVTINPAQTRSGDPNIMYNTGVINNVDVINGQNHIRWIQMPENKSEYVGLHIDLADLVKTELRALHQLDTNHVDYIEFDVDAYVASGGILAIWGAGGGPQVGNRFGGYASPLGKWYAIPEKWLFVENTNEASIFNAIRGDAHELGHTLGFDHYQGLGLDLMNWIGLAGALWHSPPHLNPWEKVRSGWIPEQGLTVVRDNTTVSLEPISNDPCVALVTLYGWPGANGDYDHSEYLVIEYRTRTGFNRFVGGKNVNPNFQGGALVWHYSSISEFDITGDVEKHLGMKVEGYGDPGPGWHDGDPSHFFPYGHEALTATTNPNSNSVDDLITGLELTSFDESGGTLTFNVNYDLGPPPEYDVVITDGVVSPPLWSGTIYVQGGYPGEVEEISAGTIVETPNSLDFPKVVAIGTSSQPILFRGVGYSDYRLPWIKVVLSSGNDVPILTEAIIEGAATGVEIRMNPAITSTPPVLSSTEFVNCDRDIDIFGAGASFPPLELSGFDGNTFATMRIGSGCKLEYSDFTIPLGSILTLRDYPLPGNVTKISLLNGNSFNVQGTIVLEGDANLEGETFNFSENLTVPSNGVLTLEPGTTLTFAQNKRLEVQGGITALGTVSGPVNLYRSGTSGTWKGIVIENATQTPSGEFDYVVVNNANTAFRVGTNADFSLSNSSVSNATLGFEVTTSGGGEPLETKTLIDNSFTYVTNGVLITNSSDVLLDGNVISSVVTEETTAGVRLIASSPQLLRNTIEGFNRGLQCLNGSSPILENGAMGGNNIIKNNTTGVYAKDNARPVLGIAGGNDEGGQNSIFNSSSYEVTLINGSMVKAENNWWGTADPQPWLFNIDASSTLDYDPWLTEDPNASSRMGGGNQLATEGNQNTGGGSTNPGGDPLLGQLLNAILGRVDGRYSETMALLKLIAEDQRLEDWVKEWAITELLAVAQNMDNPELPSYLEDLKQSSPEISRTIDFVLPHAYLNEGMTREGIAAFDANITQYPMSELERDALYGKFHDALYNNSDTSSASAILATLVANFPESDEAYVAEYQLSNFDNGTMTLRLGSEAQLTTDPLPLEYRLHQNFPNPFNPSTTIRYELPEEARVDLTIYDILGRQVTKLADEVQKAGYHSVRLDGTTLATGIYFYRFSTGSFTETRKLMLLK